jgi:hypothetical protein
VGNVISSGSSLVVFDDYLAEATFPDLLRGNTLVNLLIPFEQKAYYQTSMAGYEDELMLVSRLTGEAHPDPGAFHSRGLAGVFYESLQSETSTDVVEDGKLKILDYLASGVKAMIWLDGFLRQV